MKKINLFIILFAILTVTLGVAVSSAHAVEKNRLYFLRDDGEFTEEDKDEEAQEIYNRCARNHMYNIFFECSCVAGAFRMERDVSDEVQDVILNRIYDDRSSPCLNPAGIAGSMYRDCKESYGDDSRLIRKNIDPDEMCKCYANEIANKYVAAPIFKKRYISNIKIKSYLHCTSNTLQ